jgi:hypothetical protein
MISRHFWKFYEFAWLSLQFGDYGYTAANPDIRQVKPGIRPDNGYEKRPAYPAGYPVPP